MTVDADAMDFLRVYAEYLAAKQEGDTEAMNKARIALQILGGLL